MYPSNAIPVSIVRRLIPYHLVFNTDWTLLQAGTSISDVCPDACTPGAPFTAHWRSLQPSLVDMSGAFDGIWHIEHKEHGLQLRGRAVRLPDTNAMWLLGTPILASHEESKKLGIPRTDLSLCEFVAPVVSPSATQIANPELRVAMSQLHEAQAKSERLFELLKTQNRELQEARDKALQAAQVHYTTSPRTLRYEANRFPQLKSQFLANMRYKANSFRLVLTFL